MSRWTKGVVDLPTGAPGGLRGRVCVVSPHCDDAVLSLGAALAAHVARGGQAVVVTAFAGDPNRCEASGPWDAAAGFRTSAEAAKARRAEDRAACRQLGLEHHHVDEVDEQHPRRRSDKDLWRELEPLLTDCEEVLVPGYPLHNADHRDVKDLVLRNLAPDRPVRLYLEEPYGLRERAPSAGTADRWDGQVRWGSLPTSPRDRLAKLRAVGCYRSQLPLLGPGRLPSPSRLAAAVTVGQLWHATGTRGERLTAPVPAASLVRCQERWDSGPGSA